jgi:hypothetical protein
MYLLDHKGKIKKNQTNYLENETHGLIKTLRENELSRTVNKIVILGF